MTDTSTTPTRQELAAVGRTQPGKVTGRLRKALDAMVWQGLKRADAAKAANLSEHGLYTALRRPHVRAYYLSELEVLRSSERARNIHRLCDIRDAADNMPAVNAIKVLEQVADDDGRSHSPLQQAPGLVIVVQGGTTSINQTAKPLIEHGSAVTSAERTPYEASMAPAIGGPAPGRGRGEN